jgi:hypothetical protein
MQNKWICICIFYLAAIHWVHLSIELELINSKVPKFSSSPSSFGGSGRLACLHSELIGRPTCISRCMHSVDVPESYNLLEKQIFSDITPPRKRKKSSGNISCSSHLARPYFTAYYIMLIITVYRTPQLPWLVTKPIGSPLHRAHVNRLRPVERS